MHLLPMREQVLPNLDRRDVAFLDRAYRDRAKPWVSMARFFYLRAAISALIFPSFLTYRFIEKPGRENLHGLARRATKELAALPRA